MTALPAFPSGVYVFPLSLGCSLSIPGGLHSIGHVSCSTASLVAVCLVSAPGRVDRQDFPMRDGITAYARLGERKKSPLKASHPRRQESRHDCGDTLRRTPDTSYRADGPIGGTSPRACFWPVVCCTVPNADLSHDSLTAQHLHASCAAAFPVPRTPYHVGYQ